MYSRKEKGSLGNIRRSRIILVNLRQCFDKLLIVMEKTFFIFVFNIHHSLDSQVVSYSEYYIRAVKMRR